jgi:hypothetical protein
MCLILRQFFFDENKISISAGTAKVIFEEEKKVILFTILLC